MAIIKHLKRLSDTVRGAVTGRVCSFDKDGNIISTAKYVADMPGHPAAGDTGKVWTATGSGAASWQNVPAELPQHDVQDEGKFLGIDDQGDPVWSNIYSEEEVSPVEGVTLANASVIKIGKVVSVYFVATPEETIAAGSPVATLPASCRPSNYVYASTTGGTYVVISSTGVITRGSSISGQTSVSFTYIII